jgi:hypothetical protein
VKKRIGDRRGRSRFEIVGTLTGTFETVRRFGVRNLSTGGALVDTNQPFAPGSRIGGRLSFRGHTREVRGEVRHITTLPERHDGMRYLVGIAWDSSTNVEDVMSLEYKKPSPGGRTGSERRASPRIPGDGELGQPDWSTVELIDLSTSGVLFACSAAVDVGDKGELRVRLGERSFAAQVEIRRSDSRRTSHGAYRFGAAFVSLDEASRLHLEDFIGDARR